jgi:DNA-binding transcriptional LysR family regulator
MELRQLRYFVTVADELHFTRAAVRLHTAQSALSHQIRQLERELGVELFARTKRSVRLTDMGQMLLGHALRALEETDRIQRTAHRAAQGEVGRLTIGFVPYAAADLLPQVLAAYRPQHPDVEINLRELSPGDEIDAVLHGRVDLAFPVHRVDHPRLDVEALQRQRLVVAMPAHHPLASRRSVRMAQLAGEPWIASSLAHNTVLYQACANAGFEPLIAHHTQEFESRLTLVASGIGLTLTAESAPRLPGPQIVYKPLGPPPLTIELTAAWPNNRASPLVDTFLHAARTTLAHRATPRR